MTSCAICLEHEMTTPAACVPCGHTFCLACITKWTRSPRRFSLSLCPQCRVPIREVQKLFISDWPVSGSGRISQTPLSPWEQMMRLMTLMVHYVSIPANTLVHYGPELCRRFTAWGRQQVEQLSVVRARLVHCAVTCQREWRDLGRQGQCLVGAALLLVALLLVQDLQQEDGLHRGILLPILLLLGDIIRRLLYVAAYLLYRPSTCLLACTAEVVSAAADVILALTSAVAWVAIDALCVPWMLACVAARGLFSLLGVVAGVLRLVMLCAALALSLGLPALLAAPDNQPLRAQLPELLQAGVEWLRQVLLRHTREVVVVDDDDDGQQEAAEAERAEPLEREAGRRNIMRQFLRVLYEELRNSGQDEQEGEREGEGVGW